MTAYLFRGTGTAIVVLFGVFDLHLLHAARDLPHASHRRARPRTRTSSPSRNGTSSTVATSCPTELRLQPSGPIGESGAVGQSARCLRAQDALADGQQRGELVAGPGRIPRLPGEVGESGAGGQGVRV